MTVRTGSQLGTMIRWGTRHGIPRAFLRRAVRQGDLQAQLIMLPSSRANPYPLYESIRERGRLVQGRAAMLTVDHQLCSTILRSDSFGVPFALEQLPGIMQRAVTWAADELAIGPIDPPSLLALDPPDHTRYRRLVSKVFTARAIDALRPRVEELADGLLDQLDGKHTADLVGRYAGLLPVTVIAEILGVPTDMREQFLRWGHQAAPSLDFGMSYRTFAHAEKAIRALNAWMHGHFDRLRTTPGEDILSRLVSLDLDGERLTDRELTATANLLLAAGFETTVNLIGNGTVLLTRHPDQLEALRQEPALWPNAVEEILRLDSPVQSTARRTVVDTELAGRRVPAKTIVVTLLGGANRDPGVFPDPDRFDVRRPNARDHLAFSAGVHYCLGAALARLEGEIGLRRLFERFPHLRLVGEPSRRPTRTLRGYEVIPASLGTVRRERLAAS